MVWKVSNFVQIMRLKGMADEDVYFARRDRELIEELHKERRKKDSRSEAREQHVRRAVVGQK